MERDPLTIMSLMPALGRVVRGLSALFWGLPIALLTATNIARGESWRAGEIFGPYSWYEGGLKLVLDTGLACIPAAAALFLLLYGLRSLVGFHSQERIWIAAVERATILNVLLIGLLPFAHWWHLQPRQPMYVQSLGLFILAGITFILSLNRVLVRLAAMLPDEVLRSDTRLFAQVNRSLILLLAFLMGLEVAALWLGPRMPDVVHVFLADLSESRPWLVVMLALLPLSLTMTLLWKAKEAVLQTIYHSRSVL